MSPESSSERSPEQSPAVGQTSIAANGNARQSIVRALWAHGAVRYLLVGGLCFLADVAILWVLHTGFGVPLAVATPVAFLLSFVVTYSAQRLLAFRSESRVAPSVFRYTVLVAFNTLATTGIVWAVDAIGWHWFVGKVIAVTATTLWNFFAYKHWVFAGTNNGDKHV